MIASTQTNAPLAASSSDQRNAASVEIATARLKSAGMRITRPRIAILAALAAHAGPMSIEQLHAEVGEANCDLVTVYRCMSAFERIGLVSRAFFHNGTALFKLVLGQPERYHIICKESNRVDELDAEASADLRRAIEGVQDTLRQRGYDQVGHIVEFFGVAPSRLADRSAPPAIPAER